MDTQNITTEWATEQCERLGIGATASQPTALCIHVSGEHYRAGDDQATWYGPTSELAALAALPAWPCPAPPGYEIGWDEAEHYGYCLNAIPGYDEGSEEWRAAEVAHAWDLQDLCDALNRDVAAQDEYEEDYGPTGRAPVTGRNSDAVQRQLTDLPIFGDVAPACTLEIYSWDRGHVLRWCPSSEQLDVDGRRVGPSEWYLEDRPRWSLLLHHDEEFVGDDPRYQDLAGIGLPEALEEQEEPAMLGDGWMLRYLFSEPLNEEQMSALAALPWVREAEYSERIDA